MEHTDGRNRCEPECCRHCELNQRRYPMAQGVAWGKDCAAFGTYVQTNECGLQGTAGGCDVHKGSRKVP